MARLKSYAVDVTVPVPKALEGTDGWSSDHGKGFEQTTLLSEPSSPHAILWSYLPGRRFVPHQWCQPASKLNPEVRNLDQVEVEIAQVFHLMSTLHPKAVPTSPASFVRYWDLMNRHIHGFIRKQPEVPGESDITRAIRLKATANPLLSQPIQGPIATLSFQPC